MLILPGEIGGIGDASLYFDIYETAFTSMIDNIGKRPIFRLITPPFDQGKNVDTHCFLLL